LTATSFKLPTAVRPLYYDGGPNGFWTNENNAKLADGSYALCTLPDGSSYTPTLEETTVGVLLPEGLYLSGFGFSSDIPSNAVVTGITVHTKFFSDNGESQPNIFNAQLCSFPDAVPTIVSDYFLLQPYTYDAQWEVTTEQTIGGSTDTWQPNPCLSKDGLYMYSTDSNSYGYEVQTSTTDPWAYDFFFNGHTMIIQPTTQDYSGSSIDLFECVTDYASVLSHGGTVTFSFPGFITPVTFVAQAGAVTPGTATFRAAISNDATMQSLSDQLNGHPDVAPYISSSFFAGVQFVIQSQDFGAYTNGIAFSTNVPTYITLPNGGQMSGGAEPDPTVSTMSNYTAIAPFNTSGAPMVAQGLDGTTQILTITNSITNLTLKTSVAASVLRDTNFGILFYYNGLATTGDPLQYPSIADNVCKLDYVKISLTYTVPAGGGSNMILLKGGK
jgi:hypothetical protein